MFTVGEHFNAPPGYLRKHQPAATFIRLLMQISTPLVQMDVDLTIVVSSGIDDALFRGLYPLPSLPPHQKANLPCNVVDSLSRATASLG